MHGINGIPLAHSPGPGGVMPPPLTKRSLKPADRISARTRFRPRRRLTVRLAEFRQRVNRINLVGEAPNPPSQHPGGTPVRRLMSEKSVPPLVPFQFLENLTRRVLQAQAVLRCSQRRMC